jgi:alpha-N-arabinofuranosidase
MMNKIKSIKKTAVLLAVASIVGSTRLAAQSSAIGRTEATPAIARSGAMPTIIVNVDKPLAPIQPTMWGIFFEDINMAADGGIYAELVKNRSFEFNNPLMGWKELRKEAGSGTLLVLNRSGINPNNPRFIRISKPADEEKYGLSNEGFRGMGIEKGHIYDFSVWAAQHPGSHIRLHISLVNAASESIGEVMVAPSDTAWTKYQASITATATEPRASLSVWFEGSGVVDLDMISLFPKNTWKGRPGGLRADLVKLLADLRPGFLRFPGGCIVEGRELATRYQWKKTIGRVEDRKTIINRWNTEFAHKLTPDYYQSYGLGFFEYFQLAEDIGASPLPILNCGMACQFNTSEVVPTDELDPYIQDALDLIEFANGSTDTKWGHLREVMGHPAPFHLQMMGVGNEQWGPQYIERYRIFTAAIKAKYPNIKLVNSVGPDPDGDKFNFLNDTLRKMHADFLDEHYYRSPEWFLQNASRYDKYDRNGPKIFAGEYAAQSVATVSPLNKNNWKCALSEAAFMTGLERNADVVNMASYAPLFAHTAGWQWTPDLIWFDNLHSYGTPDYYVQKLFSNNKGDYELSILSNNQVLAGRDSLYAAACFDTGTREIILKLVNTSGKARQQSIRLDGAKKLAPNCRVILLQSDDINAENSLADAMALSPKEIELAVKGRQLNITLAPNSFTVIKVMQMLRPADLLSKK